MGSKHSRATKPRMLHSARLRIRSEVRPASLGGREAFEGPESVEGLDKFLGLGQDGDGIWFEAGAGSLAGFELAVKEEGGIGEFFSREAEGGAKRIFFFACHATDCLRRP